MIKAVCYRYVGYETEESKDLFHDIVISVLTKVNSYQSHNSLRSWIYKISVNKCIDFLRLKQIHRTESSDDSLVEFAAPEHHDDTLTMDQLVQIINTLPVNQKLAFNLYEVEGYTEQEIVEIMGMTPTNVRTLISRSKQSLRKRITAYLGKEIDIL